MEAFFEFGMLIRLDGLARKGVSSGYIDHRVEGPLGRSTSIFGLALGRHDGAKSQPVESAVSSLYESW